MLKPWPSYWGKKMDKEQCPQCRGTGETPQRGYVIQGPNARYYETERRAALRFARSLCAEGCSPGEQVLVYAPQCAYRVARYRCDLTGRVVKVVP